MGDFSCVIGFGYSQYIKFLKVVKVKKDRKLQIIIDGFLYTTRLGREGEKFVTIEYPSSEALKLAQLELMGRDLKNHLPVLLRTSYEVSSEKKEKKSRQASTLSNSRSITRKNKRVF